MQAGQSQFRASQVFKKPMMCQNDVRHTALAHCGLTHLKNDYNKTLSAVNTDKCRGPFRGGCADQNRECIATEFDISCGACLLGYTEVEYTCYQGLLQFQLYNILVIILAAL